MSDYENSDSLGPLFAAKEAADEGIQKSADAAGAEWVRVATEFVHHFLIGHSTMHVDQLWAGGLEEPGSKRALGQVVRNCMSNGWIEQITTPQGWVCAKPSASSNGQLKPVWRSKLYRTES